MSEEEKKLTPKQELFISEYLLDFNATRAAKAAGYSDQTAYKMGYENLLKPQIREEIKKHIDKALEDNEITLKSEILSELRAIAFADISRDVQIVTNTITDEDGKEKQYQTVEFTDTKDSDQTRAISSIKISDKGAIEVKYHSKERALELLGKYMEMFNDNKKIDLTGVTLNISKDDGDL